MDVGYGAEAIKTTAVMEELHITVDMLGHTGVLILLM